MYNVRNEHLVLGGFKMQVVGYSDMDWEADLETRWFRGAYIPLMGNGPIMSAPKLLLLALSTME